MSKQYYKIAAVQKPDGEFHLEFHTGTDKAAVTNMQSLNHGLKLCPAGLTEVGSAKWAAAHAETINRWNMEISVYNLERVQS